MSDMTLQSYIQDKKYLFWYVSDTTSLSDESIIEAIIKYGTWQDIKNLIKIQESTIKKQYLSIIRKPRCNLNQREMCFMNKLLEHV